METMNTTTHADYTVQDLGRDIRHYLIQIKSRFAKKLFWGACIMALSGAISTHTAAVTDALEQFATYFGGDAKLLLMLLLLMLIDLLVGFAKPLCRKEALSWSILQRGALKWPLYAFLLLLVGILDVMADGAIPFWDLPLLNLFTAYLGITEFFSICKNLEALGVRVPSLLLMLAKGFRRRIEKAIEKELPTQDKPEHERLEDKEDGRP